MREGISAEAFLLFDPSMNPVFVSRRAVEVLLYPHKVEPQINLDTTLSGEIRGKLLWAKFSGSPGLVDRLQSGKRLYQCRAVRGFMLLHRVLVTFVIPLYYFTSRSFRHQCS